GELDKGEYMGAKALGEKLDLPVNYLGKTMQMLAKKGYLYSRKGLGGGFALVKDAGAINILEVVESLGEGKFFTDCFWGSPECSEDSPCPMHSKWKGLSEQFRDVLNTTTIEHLMQEEK
ncbi:RrF2 family transcriptional regulator, partial [candidate division KSB1 bacterium]